MLYNNAVKVAVWLGAILVALMGVGTLCAWSWVGAFRDDNTPATIARSKHPQAAAWIKSLGKLEDGQELTLPPHLKDMTSRNGSVTVRQYGDDTWVVIRCYVENIDNGEGFAYCLSPRKSSLPNFEEQQLEAKSIDDHWVWFRFT